MKGSDNQEKLVYQIIEDAGNKGDQAELCPCLSRCGLQEVLEYYILNDCVPIQGLQLSKCTSFFFEG